MAAKQQNNSQKKPRGKGKPFKPNDPKTGEKDERINRKGRIIPKDVLELNAVIDEMFAEEVTDIHGNKMDKLRAALNRLLLSKNPSGPIHVLDRRFGKVPQAVDVTSAGESLAPKVSDEERMQRMKELAAAIAQEISKDA